MSRRLDREGIFKAKPVSWGVQRREDSQAVAVVIEFRVIAQLNNNVWDDWAEYEEHTIFGNFYVIKKSGEINQVAVTNLVQSIGWSGSLLQVQGPAPEVVVQITVKDEPYQGQSRLKVAWINPENYTPAPATLPPGDIKKIEQRYGSLLRAAAAGAEKAAVPKPRAKAAPPSQEPPPPDDDDLPF